MASKPGEFGGGDNRASCTVAEQDQVELLDERTIFGQWGPCSRSCVTCTTHAPQKGRNTSILKFSGVYIFEPSKNSQTTPQKKHRQEELERRLPARGCKCTKTSYLVCWDGGWGLSGRVSLISSENREANHRGPMSDVQIDVETGGQSCQFVQLPGAEHCSRSSSDTFLI